VSLQVGVVGGSIAGCAVAATLSRQGHNVQVFESSAGHLKDRGAGIILSRELIAKLQAQDLLDAKFPHLPLDKREYFRRKQEGSDHIWSQPMAAAATNWDILYSNLRRRIPENSYHGSCPVREISNDPSHPRILVEDGREFSFDLLVFADGHESLGRSLMYPGTAPLYAGYVLWRGLLPAARCPEEFSTKGAVFTYLFSGGHLLFYLVPDPTTGTNLMNWALYQCLPEGNLPLALTDHDGKVHHGSLPPGLLRREARSQLEAFATSVLPSSASQLIALTEKPFLQVIYDCLAPGYGSGNSLLIGDAGALARPHTGAGAVKALSDVYDLADVLSTGEPAPDLLENWRSRRHANGKEMVSLGRALGRGLVTNCPDWQQFTSTSMENWFADLLSSHKWYAVDEVRR